MNITGTGIAGTFTGRQLDKGGQVFNVKGYGAKGDNLTDDTAAIQSAISACQSGGGGVVFLPSGNYRTTGLTVTGQGVVLQGTPQSTLIGTSTTQWVLLFDGPGNLAFHNELLTLTIGHANQGQSSSVGAVRLFNQAQFLISDVRVGASAGGGLPNLGIYLENAQNGTVMNSIIGGLGNGVTLYKSGNLTLNNILVANTGGTGFLIDAVGGLWGYALQTYNNSGFGFYIYDSIPNDGYFSENQFYTACAGDTSGLPNWVVASVRRLSLDHCWGASNISKDQNTWASGFYFIGTINGSGYSSVTDVTMTGCWAVQNNKHGIEIADAQNVSVLNCEVLGNSVSGNSQEGIGILGRSSNIRLVGNRCRDDHLEFPVPSPKTQLAGIAVRDLSDSIVAIGNDVQGNIAAVGINDSAAPTTRRVYRGNLGYNPLVTVPQPTVAASGTAVPNTTNVDCTVFVSGGGITSVAIGGVATGIAATNTSYRVPAGSSITLSYSSPPTWRWVGE